MADDAERPIIIKKVKKADHAHHGGAWKIAYADFVTAMMAFFLLLWLISMTTPEQKQGLADYFTPPNVIASQSGAGGVLGGTSVDETGAGKQGAAIDGNRDVTNPPVPADGQTGTNGQQKSPEAAKADKSNQDMAFESAAASIRQAWQADPNLTQMQSNLVVERTDDGLDIEILNNEGVRMFPEGSKYPTEPTRAALTAIAPILQRLPNQIRISGHTAAGTVYANPRYGAWELSSDRANVVRSVLGEAGLSDDHIDSVVGRATAEPFFASDPYMAANERIKITALYGAPPVPPGLKP